MFFLLEIQVVNNISKWNQVQEELNQDVVLTAVVASPVFINMVAWICDPYIFLPYYPWSGYRCEGPFTR